MTLRDATLDDVPRLVAMGQHFLHSTPYRSVITDNPAQMSAMATMLITSENGLLLVADEGGVIVGMIGVFLYAHHLSAERIAGEVFWWVEPSKRGSLGIRLLRGAERWAVAQGVDTMQMIAPNPEVAQIYHRLGYAQVEVAYQKRIA